MITISNEHYLRLRVLFNGSIADCFCFSLLESIDDALFTTSWSEGEEREMVVGHHTDRHTDTHTQTHRHMHTYTCTHTHTRTHTHT